MVDWEDEDAGFMAASTDPAMIKLREGMKYIEYEVVPEVRERNKLLLALDNECDFSCTQLKDVYGGNTVYLDWYIALETALHLKYMTADGKPLVLALLCKYSYHNCYYCAANVLGPR